MSSPVRPAESVPVAIPVSLGDPMPPGYREALITQTGDTIYRWAVPDTGDQAWYVCGAVTPVLETPAQREAAEAAVATYNANFLAEFGKAKDKE